MTNPITVIDADLIPEGGPINTVHVWYEAFGYEMTQTDFPGHDFFLRWLPDFAQRQYQDIRIYWRTIHPHRRNEHIASYLLDRSKIQLN